MWVPGFSRTLTYIEKTGNSIENRTIEISSTASGVRFLGNAPDDFYSYTHSNSCNGINYSKKEHGKTITVKRMGKELTVVYNGKETSFTMEDGKWRQMIYLAEDFILSPRKNEKFWVVSDSVQESEDEAPEIKCVQFILKKKDIETISVNGENISAHKVIMTFPDYKSAFWKAELWYDTSGLLVKSKIKRGGPWAEYTITELVSDNKEDAQ